MSTCCFCGAPLLWGLSRKQRRMPLDRGTVTDGVRFRIDDDGYAVAVTDDGDGHASHFATCPNAQSHRRRTTP